MAVLGFFFLIATSVASDGYWLWLRLYGGSLTILWNRRSIFSAPIPFFQGPRIPLWIPFASLSIHLFYIFIVGKRLGIRIRICGRRLHHYHIGIMALGLSALLWHCTVFLGFKDSSLWIFLKRTSLSEVLEGLSFIFLLGGAFLSLIDRRDLLLAMKVWLKGFDG